MYNWLRDDDLFSVAPGGAEGSFEPSELGGVDASVEGDVASEGALESSGGVFVVGVVGVVGGEEPVGEAAFGGGERASVEDGDVVGVEEEEAQLHGGWIRGVGGFDRLRLGRWGRGRVVSMGWRGERMTVIPNEVAGGLERERDGEFAGQISTRETVEFVVSCSSHG